MTRLAPISIVLFGGEENRLATAVLASAVDVHPATRGWPVRFAARREELVAACRAGVARGVPVVAGWSFSSAAFARAAADLGWVRQSVNGVLHVAGGPHATAEPAQVLAAGFDLAALGEGEESFPRLVARVAAGEPAVGAGLAWLQAGEVVRGPPVPSVDLDAFPPFRRGLGRLGPIELSRGCAHACRFCQTSWLHGGRVRHRSVDRVREAVATLVQLGARDVRFVTPSALSYGSRDGAPRLDALEALLAAVRAEVGPARRVYLGTFPSEVRPEQVSREALELLRRWVDNRDLLVGGQSGSDRLLARAHRGHTAGDTLRAAELAVQCGFRPLVDLIFGLPGEAEADREETRRHLLELGRLGARVHAHAFMPLPGTPEAHAEPGAIDPATRRELDRLASRGLLYGQWRRQEALAAERAGLQAPPAGSRSRRA